MKSPIADNKKLGNLVKKASSAYSMWHQKHPKNVQEISVNWPKVVYCLGRAEEIIYRSDKWEKDNDFFTYQHFFDTRPYVYCAKDSIFKDLLLEGSRKNPGKLPRKRSVSRLLNVKDLDKDVVVAPNLATTEELTITANDGSVKQFNLQGPSLCCTLDMRTLIICMKDDLLFINGGAMKVTERGIVK